MEQPMTDVSTRDPLPPWWRAKIGLIIPSPSVVSFLEQQAICPEGVTVLHTRVMLKETTPEVLSKLSEDALYAAELLATAKPNVISYTCTSSSLIKGAEYEKALIQKLEMSTGIKTTSMATAVVEALTFLGIKRVVVVAPYLAEITRIEEEYLRSFGFDVVYSKTLGITDPAAITGFSPRENYEFALGAFRAAPETDALFISCAGLRTVDIIERLEKATGKPVLSSNQCNAWLCLKLSGIREPISGFGRLLARER
jgi:maleate isomerase